MLVNKPSGWRECVCGFSVHRGEIHLLRNDKNSTHISHSLDFPVTLELPTTIWRTRKLLSLLIFRLPGVDEHNVGGELMTSLATLTVKSEYNAFIVCRMIPDDATYSCKPKFH